MVTFVQQSKSMHARHISKYFDEKWFFFSSVRPILSDSLIFSATLATSWVKSVFLTPLFSPRLPFPSFCHKISTCMFGKIFINEPKIMSLTFLSGMHLQQERYKALCGFLLFFLQHVFFWLKDKPVNFFEFFRSKTPHFDGEIFSLGHLSSQA